MNLMSEIEENVEKNYIGVREAILMILDKNLDDYWDVAKFLTYHEFDINIPLWQLTHYFQFQEDNESWIVPDIIRCLTSRDNDKEILNRKIDYVFSEFTRLYPFIKGYYWKKVDFFNFHPIRSFDLPTQAEWIIDDSVDKKKADSDKFFDDLFGESDPSFLDDLDEQAEITATKLKVIDSEKMSELSSNNFSTKSKNSVVKLICVLADMANISTSEPFSCHAALKVHSELLGIEGFPNKDTVAAWLKKANSLKKN